MAIIPDDRIMFYIGKSIDNATFPDACVGIYQGMVHDNRPFTDKGMFGNGPGLPSLAIT